MGAMGQQLTNLPQRVTEAQSYLRTKELEIRTKREREERSTEAEQPRVVELQSHLQIKEQEIRSMREQGELLKAEQPRVNALQRELRTKEQQMTAMKEQLQRKDTDIAILQEEQQQQLQSQLIIKEEEMTALKVQLEEKETDMATLQVELSQERQRVTERLQEVRTLSGQLTDLQGQLQAKETTIAALEEQLRGEGQRVAELQSQLGTRQLQEVRTLTGQLADLQGQLQEKETTIASLEEQLRGERQQHAELLRSRTPRPAQEEQRQGVTDPHSELRTNEQEARTMTEQLRQTQQRLSDNPPDWVINRNEIQMTVEELGRGAWGNVVRGKFRRCDVAVKEMYEDIFSPQNKQLFEREVDIASKCRHPCLLQFIGATNDERPLLVTELMDCSLRTRLYDADEPPLSEAEVSVISLDVARAVNYLHQKKPTPMIHHDISSANVLLWRQGNQWRGKVSDYGTANFVRQSTRDSPGAAIYCAPEFLNEALNQPISCKVSNTLNKLKNWTKFEGLRFTDN